MNNNIINSSKISFVTVTHNNFLEVAEYLDGVKKIIGDKIDITLICDGLLSSIDKEKLSIFDLNIKYNDLNIGKLNSLIKWSHTFNKKFFKIIDSDDCFNIVETIELIKASESFNDNTFYTHDAAKVYKKSKFFGTISTDNNVINEIMKYAGDVNWEIPPNAKSIYSVESLLYLSNIKINRQNYYNDDLLSIVNLWISKYKSHVTLRPYIQYHSRGQTSSKSLNRYKELYKLNVNLLKILKSISSKQKIYELISLETLRNRRLAQERLNGTKKSFLWKFMIKLSNWRLYKAQKNLIINYKCDY